MLRKRGQGEKAANEEEISNYGGILKRGTQKTRGIVRRLFGAYERAPGDGKYALQWHLFAQVVFFGLLMVGVLLSEVISLNLISQPTEQQKESYRYNIKQLEVWQAQLFKDYFGQYVFGDALERNRTKEVEEGQSARKFQFDLFFAHYYLFQLSLQRFFNAHITTFPPSIQSVYYKLHPHYTAINYTMVEILNEVETENSTKFLFDFDDEFSSLPSSASNSIDFDTTYDQFYDYFDQFVSDGLEDAKTSVIDEVKAITSAKRRTMLSKPADCLPLLHSLDRHFSLVERILIDFISLPKQNLTKSDYFEFYSETYGMLARIQRTKHIHWLYERALLQATNDTLEAILIYDSGKHIFASFGEQSKLFWLIFRYDAVFDFGHLVAAILSLGAFWWFYSEKLNEQIANEEAGFMRWRKREFSALLAIAINFFLSMFILRSIRVVSYWSTILPNENIYCKLRKFKEGVTWSSPFIDQLIQVFTKANNTNGGCNDLIFSGHVSLYVMCSILFYRYCPSVIITSLVFLVALEPTIDAVIKGQHYSVDVLIAIYLTLVMDYIVNKDILPLLVGPKVMETLSKVRTLSTKSFASLYREILFIFSIFKRVLFYFCCCFVCFGKRVTPARAKSLF